MRWWDDKYTSHHPIFNVLLSSDIIIMELQSWKRPYRSPSPAPVKEAQWGIKLPASGSAAKNLNH